MDSMLQILTYPLELYNCVMISVLKYLNRVFEYSTLSWISVANFDLSTNVKHSDVSLVPLQMVVLMNLW